MRPIVILGAGVMGSALAMPLADNAHDLRLVWTHLDRENIDAIGVVAEDDFPLMRHLYEVVALERPLNIPWKRFFGSERLQRVALYADGRSRAIAAADGRLVNRVRPQALDFAIRLAAHPSHSPAITERTGSHG